MLEKFLFLILLISAFEMIHHWATLIPFFSTHEVKK